MHHGLLPETHFGLRRMHIHVNLSARQFQKQQHHRIHRRRNDIAIRLGQPMLYQPVANQPSIHKYKYRIPIQLLNLRLRNETVKPHLARILFRNLAILFHFLATPRRRLRQSHALQRSLRGHRDQTGPSVSLPKT